MALARPGLFQRRLVAAGMPEEVARHEAPLFDKSMKHAILRLYRSAKEPRDWEVDFSGIADRGLVLWGSGDPFVPVKYARSFAERWSLPLRVEKGAGHWGICARPEAFAAHLTAHWAQ